MKESKKLYLRTFYISCVLLLCGTFAFWGIAKAYENTVQIGFGEYKKAVELGDGFIRILDFYIEF